MNSPSLDDGPDAHRFIVTARRSLLAELVAAISQGAPLLALTGPPGSGKSTLAEALHEELLSRSVHVLRADRGESQNIDLRAFASQLLDKAETDFDADDIEALFDVLTTRSVPDQKVVLIIDNAELLRADALGYLRLLSSIAMDAMPQIVFIGDPSFWNEAEHAARADIRELVTDRRELELLSEAETQAFAERAMSPSAFGEGAHEALVRHGNGVIGRIAWLLALAKTLKDDWRLEALSPAAIDAAAARLDAAAAPEGEPADALPATAATTADPIAAIEPAHRRLGVTPRLGLVLGMAAIGAVVYWQAGVHGERMVALAGSVFVAGGLTPPLHQTQTAAVPAEPAIADPPAPPDLGVAAVELPVPPAPVQPSQARPSWLLADLLDQAVATDPALDAAPGGTVDELPTSSPVEASVQPAVAAAEAVVANAPPEEILPGPGDMAASQEPSPGVAAQADGPTPNAAAAAAPAPEEEASPQAPLSAAVTATQGSAMADAAADVEPAAAPGSAANGPLDATLAGPGDVVVSREPSPPGSTPVYDAARNAAAASGPPRSDASPPKTRPPAPAASVTPLLSRGDAMVALGDIAAARLFYERAAGLGSAQGAVSLGKTYDPRFLASIQAAGVTPNRDAAASWYQKGAALGDTEGSHLLVMLTAGR